MCSLDNLKLTVETNERTGIRSSFTRMEGGRWADGLHSCQCILSHNASGLLSSHNDLQTISPVTNL